jgi:hypothetical protein
MRWDPVFHIQFSNQFQLNYFTRNNTKLEVSIFSSQRQTTVNLNATQEYDVTHLTMHFETENVRNDQTYQARTTLERAGHVRDSL